MLARLLQTTSLLLVAAAIGLALLLVALGAPLIAALIAAALLPLAFHGVPLAIEFIYGAFADRRPGRRIGLVGAARVWLGETWRAFISFTIDQPWRAGFAEPTTVHDPVRPAVLLVHGYFCNRAVWRPWLLGSGIGDRWNVATINLEPVLAALDAYVDPLRDAVESLRSASGSERITIVAHSMGGLAVRGYLRTHGDAAVARVITIDTPHQGTVFARFGKGLNTRQMQRGCDYLQQLGSVAEPVEFVCFASRDDNLIVPREAQALACAEVIWFDRIGHLAMTASDLVLTKLIEVVERPLSTQPQLDAVK
ncbi:MAG: lipase family alpha/beta hydrolase [Burkholderiaceae bacterium]